MVRVLHVIMWEQRNVLLIFLAASVLVYELDILYLRYMYIYKAIDINTFEKIVTGRSP